MRNYVQMWLRQSFALTWGWGDTLSGLIGSAIPIAAHFFPEWGEQVSDSLWMVPVWGLAAAALFRLVLIAPYELWRRERARADSATSDLEAIGQSRPLRFGGVEFRFDYSKGPIGPLVIIRFAHHNLSANLVSYRLANVWAEIEGQTVAMNVRPTPTYEQPLTAGHFDCPLPEPMEITTFPAPVRVNFDYYYDTVPATRERRSGATLRYVLTGPNLGDPVEGYWYDDQREE